MQENALIVFAREPVLGKVKTRLAATIGDEAALRIYIRLLTHTREVAMQVHCDTHVFLTAPPVGRFWQDFSMHLQADGDLGDKMHNAFSKLFGHCYHNVIIIGSDCPGLDAAIVEQAFAALADNDIVLGPAADGGYYLLGMKRLHNALFRCKSWSTDTVCAETLDDIAKAGLSVALLPELSDIDTEEDLKTTGWL